jgi:hypothetical protein
LDVIQKIKISRIEETTVTFGDIKEVPKDIPGAEETINGTNLQALQH